MNYEEAVSRCWAEISLGEICNNYRRAREIARTKVICVLKGNAYGLGAVEVCRALMGCGAETFAVACGDEAEELLAGCPGAEVLILGHVGEAQARRLIPQNVIFTVYSYEQGVMLGRASAQAGRSARVHVKADTGLHRLGFCGPEAADEIAKLNAAGLLRMEGLYTHLALHNRVSDELQFARFTALRKALEGRGVYFQCVHALDSIGMVRYPEHAMDAVRTGAWLYGVYPRGYEHPEESQLTMTVKARVAQLHTVPAGECLGYDEDNPLARDSVIATISAGYIDGFPRLNNTGTVEIRGKRAPVAGLVCMDQMMADVTDIPGVREGDEVILLGGSIGVDEYASVAHLNRNESLARTGRRVPRVYMENGEVTDIVQEM